MAWKEEQRHCEEKIRLVVNYSAAVAMYYQAVSELERGMVGGSQEVYAELQRSTEEARMMCEAARKELDDHVSAHGCQLTKLRTRGFAEV